MEISSKKFLEYAYQMYGELPTREINLAYVGGLTQDVTVQFATMIEDHLVSRAERSPVQRKVFNVMIEALQNIVRHAVPTGEFPQGIRKGVLIVSHNDQAYKVVTGNLIHAAQREALRGRLEGVNHMDKGQLMEAYKRQIAEGHISEAGGAGLGFLDIAKKSGNPIEFRFFPVDGQPDYLFFLTVATISR